MASEKGVLLFVCFEHSSILFGCDNNLVHVPFPSGDRKMVSS